MCCFIVLPFVLMFYLLAIYLLDIEQDKMSSEENTVVTECKKKKIINCQVYRGRIKTDTSITH